MQLTLFETAIRGHQRRVFTLACYLLGSREEAEDVTQEVLIRLWRRPEMLQSMQLGPWLLRVTRNACYDLLRRRRAGLRRLEPDDLEGVVSQLPSPHADPEQRAASAELGRQLRTAIHALDEPMRSIVILREVQGLTYREIGDVLELPLSTIRVALHRARRRLRDRLGKEAAHHVVAV